MDLINNILFTALTPIQGRGALSFPPLAPAYFDLPPTLGGPPLDGIPTSNPLPSVREGSYYAYDINVLEEFAGIDDPGFIDNALQKHWADMVNGRDYPIIPAGPDPFYTSFHTRDGKHLLPPYHIVYAYLVENTRIVQIVERMLGLYMNDEKLNKATTDQNRLAFQWLVNTESLFFRPLTNTDYRNTLSQVRALPESGRRNVYFRMLGMDLAFGEAGSNANVNYFKAEFNNQLFIVLFENFLREIWQAYINAKNSSGVNTTDLFIIVDTGRKMQEMLMARRTTELTFDNYRYFNLSREEYAAVAMMNWLYEAVSYDSPIVQFLRCNGNSPGERVTNLGNNVGVQAHSKSEGLLDIAPPMNTLLRLIELGDYNPGQDDHVDRIITAQAQNLPATDPDLLALNDLLLIINNWEKATGHKIKNPEANISGTVKLHSNGQEHGAKPPQAHPQMN